MKGNCGQQMWAAGGVWLRKGQKSPGCSMEISENSRKGLGSCWEVVEVRMAELAQRGPAPALAAEMSSFLTTQGMVTFATSPWSSWANPRGRWGKMDGCFPQLSTPAGAGSEQACSCLAPQWLFHWKYVVLCNKRTHLPDGQGSDYGLVTPWTLRLCEGAPSTFTVLTQPK